MQKIKSNKRTISLCSVCTAPICDWLLSGGGGRTPQPMKGQVVAEKDYYTKGKLDMVSYITVECPQFQGVKRGTMSFKNTDKNWAQQDIDLLIELYQEGISYPQIAKLMGRSYASVNYKLHVLRETGVIVGRGGITQKCLEDTSGKTK